MIVKLLTEHHLEFLSLKGGCRGPSESTHIKVPHCWKSHALAHFYIGLLCYFYCYKLDVQNRSIQNKTFLRKNSIYFPLERYMFLSIIFLDFFL